MADILADKEKGTTIQEFVEGPERDALFLFNVVRDALEEWAPSLFLEGVIVDKAKVAELLSEELKKITPKDLQKMFDQAEESKK